MKPKLPLTAVGHATSALFLISFVLCVAFDLIFPEHAMYQSWQNLLPGFEWLSWTSFFLGAIESYLYGWFVALIWVPIYNIMLLRANKENTKTAV
ncbi:hypothetical protein MNBD_GAMMA22-669 [hydrothermal vent metagenome]|uniref:Uncharacterized protein n=1 Tax=hydrothermal vent metagenome TaxID=652676 RepID=A0A3B0ZZ39_9ZZZZ